MKQIFLSIFLASSCLGATTIIFSDSVNVVSSPPPIVLDSSPYANTVINQGGWQAVANTFTSTISSLEIDHYIFLFGSGTLNTVKVFGTTQSVVSLVANPGTFFEQTFIGSPGTTSNEYIFDMNGYNFQPNVTTISGFSTISTINFAGTYTVVPEPSTMLLAGMATMSLLLHRRRN